MAEREGQGLSGLVQEIEEIDHFLEPDRDFMDRTTPVAVAQKAGKVGTPTTFGYAQTLEDDRTRRH